MTVVYTIPNWFSGYDIVMEILFALITGLVAFYSFKIYSLSQQRESKLFGVGFSLISLSYLLWAALNFSIMDNIKDGVTILELEKLNVLNYFSIYLHIILFLVGLLTIFYMTLKIKNIKLYLLLSALVLLGIYSSFNVVVTFYFFAAAFIFFILVYYINNYWENRNQKTLFVIFGFFFLLCSSLSFMVFKFPTTQYVISHCLNFLAYIFILVDLLIIIRGSKKFKISKSFRAKVK